jgi:hypothetical protein
MQPSLKLLHGLTGVFEEHSVHWQRNHDEAIQCLDLEEIIRIGIRIYDILADNAIVTRRISDEVAQSGRFDGIILLKDVMMLYDDWCIASKRFEEAIRVLREKGYEIRGSDQFLGCMLDAERNYARWHADQVKAMHLRATWMRSAGLSEEEIAEHCDLKQFPADLAEEQKNIIAQSEMANAQTAL